MLDALTDVRVLTGNDTLAYRDPAVLYEDGVFHLFFSMVRIESDSVYSYVAKSESRDLREWTEPRILTPRDQKLDFSSPGDVVRFGDEWILCMQTYPRPDYAASQGIRYGDETARLYMIRSRDLELWGEPELLKVKGPDVAEEDMGRMIDPYLVEDKDEKGKWWCFYKQNGVSMSCSHDLEDWTFCGSTDSGENVCVWVEGDEYMLMHSPSNGLGIKHSRDLVSWADTLGIATLGQAEWLWAQGRLTAGAVLDCRDVPEVGAYLLFFHGSGPRTEQEGDFDRNCHIGLAWSSDLEHWKWAK